MELIRTFLNWIEQLDLMIMHWIHFLHNPILDKIMIFITHLGDLGIVWIAMALFFLFRKQFKSAVSIIFSLATMALINNFWIKPLFMRLRPFQYTDFKPLIPEPHGSSFPSSHAATSSAGATATANADKWLAWASWIIAGLISFSRVYVHVHHPSDVIVGFLVGMVVSHLCIFLVNRLPWFHEKGHEK